jgi:hypothetical protein
MIDPASGIAAFITPYRSGEPYSEYEGPFEYAFHGSNNNSRYIEAVTNERYIITVKLPKDFDFIGTSAVSVQCRVYAGDLVTVEPNASSWLEFEYVRKAQNHHGSQPSMVVFSSFIVTCNGETRLYGLRCRDPGILGAGDVPLSGIQETEDKAFRGKILISVSRGI